MNVHFLGTQEYTKIWEKMKAFTAARHKDTPDELWILEHFPVYTQGQAGKPEHILHHNDIPIVQSDRGGQITYHGPGQLVAYVLMDLSRQGLGVRTLVSQLELSLIEALSKYKIQANTKCNAPGVYVGDQKIASIGLRVKNGCTYHGIALNVRMDLKPFSDINPCGFSALKMTQISNYDADVAMEEVHKEVAHSILKLLG